MTQAVPHPTPAADVAAIRDALSLLPETVLVVDDDDDIRDLVAFKLRYAGYQVVTAENGRLALALAHRECPDLIVLDVAMPGLDGLEVCTALHAAPETTNIPVLMLSARAEPVDIERALTVGADDYLTKPFGTGDLVERVRRLILAHS